jgi:1-acyl-sn-glycerol-3-phosphate acyltransferase
MTEDPTGEAPFDWEPPRRGSALRAVLSIPIGVLWCLVNLPWMIGVMALTPKYFEKNRTRVTSSWGRGLLWIFGIKLELHGTQYRDLEGAKVLAINHVSIVDLFVYSAAWTDHGTMIYKKELSKIPLMGRVMKMIGFIQVDRSDHRAAIKSMAEAAKRIRETGLSIWIAPEGTRSRLGGLQEFKVGAFHMAMQTGAPIIPCIMRGAGEINPMGSLLIRSGTIRVDYLAPVETKDWKRPQLRVEAVKLRKTFLQYLPPAPDSPTLEDYAREEAEQAKS